MDFKKATTRLQMYREKIKNQKRVLRIIEKITRGL